MNYLKLDTKRIKDEFKQAKANLRRFAETVRAYTAREEPRRMCRECGRVMMGERCPQRCGEATVIYLPRYPGEGDAEYAERRVGEEVDGVGRMSDEADKREPVVRKLFAKFAEAAGIDAGRAVFTWKPINDDLACFDNLKPQLGRGIDWEAVLERLRRPGDTPEQEAERMAEIGKQLWEMSGE